MKKLKLASGIELGLLDTPYSESWALVTAVMTELKVLKLNPSQEIDVNFYKDVVCAGIQSSTFNDALEICMERCTYGGQKITRDTWEPVNARGDKLQVMWEVAQHNIAPFMKNLSSVFTPLKAIEENFRLSKSLKT